ncbi:hypothetical protein RRG08_061768 [Elysia crispata]|uniref:Uncharacterized protein n=1 Tax=Elysia crispata TaxID=231223 RepID=A0AAE1A7P7_9GAST|nr:hypothetical protein RRG08_061768 [Elysia crispata]
MNWKCYDCNMTFTNPSLLQKHKARFCIGGMGDPDQLMLRRGLSHAGLIGSKRLQYEKNEPVMVQSYGRPQLPRYNPSNDPKVKQLAESHGRNMENYHSKNRDLERQREGRHREKGIGEMNRENLAERARGVNTEENHRHGSETDVCQICKEYVSHWPLINPEEEIIELRKAGQ